MTNTTCGTPTPDIDNLEADMSEMPDAYIHVDKSSFALYNSKRRRRRERTAHIRRAWMFSHRSTVHDSGDRTSRRPRCRRGTPPCYVAPGASRRHLNPQTPEDKRDLLTSPAVPRRNAPTQVRHGRTPVASQEREEKLRDRWEVEERRVAESTQRAEKHRSLTAAPRPEAPPH